MRIAVILTDELRTFPPAIGLVDSLVQLGHSVILMSYGADKIVDIIPNHQTRVDYVSFGKREKSRRKKIGQTLNTRKRLRSLLKENAQHYDLIWAVTDKSAREAGEAMQSCPYIISISELREKAPAMVNGIFGRNKPVIIQDRKVKKLVQEANRVVVPEYNRAHMQAALWNLPRVPAVLPNKQTPPEVFNNEKSMYQEIHNCMKKETRRIIIYQGIFTNDRDLKPFVDALDYLNNEYAIYLFGRIPSSQDQKKVDELTCGRDDVVYCGFIPAPDHLQFTSYASIGLLPYTAPKKYFTSPLNALYCAPNKIWEYAYYGLPMLGSDVPGLTLPFEKFEMGMTVSSDSPAEIADCVRAIEKKHAIMSENAKSFFDSLDFTAEVERILEEALS